MIETGAPPKLRCLVAVAACPEELLVPLGAMVGAFAEGGTAIHAVLLSDGLNGNATAESRLERNHRLARAADRLGVAQLVTLDHPVTDVPRTDVQTMAREVLAALERVDAVLVADPNDRRDRSARGRLAAFRTGLRVAAVIDAPLYACAPTRPSPTEALDTIEVGVSRISQRSAIAHYQGIPEVPGRHRPDEPDVEYLFPRHRRSPSLGSIVG